jgi:hypothetical protein
MKRGSAFPHNNHGQDAGSDGEVDWNHPQTSTKRVLALEHSILSDGEDNDPERTGNAGGNEPSGEDLRNTFPAPDDPISAESRNADADESTDDAMPVEEINT